MTLFVSVALFWRDGQLTFKAPRKEASGSITQARKAAARYWSGRISAPDKLQRVFVVSAIGSIINVSECTQRDGMANKWVEYSISASEAKDHIAECVAELGVDQDRAPPAMPDVLEINGVVYRREI